MLVSESDGHGFGDFWTGAIKVFDFSRWANPQRVGGTVEQWSSASVAASGHHACVGARRGASDWAGLFVFDCSGRARPRQVGEFRTDWSLADMAVAENRSRVAAGAAGLQVIDVSDPTTPRSLGAFRTATFAQALALSGRHALVFERPSWDSQGQRYFGTLQILDGSNPAAPRRAGEIETDGVGYAVAAAAAGQFAYVAGDRGFQVIDVSDPAHPQRVGGHDVLGFAGRIHVEGHLAYMHILDSDILPWRLEVLDVSDPTTPRRVGGNGRVIGFDIAFADNSLLVVGETGLTVLNPYVGLRFLPPSRLQPRELRVSLTGPPDWPVRIHRSADRTTWQDWQTLTTRGATPVELSDSDATSQPHHVYRAVAP